MIYEDYHIAGMQSYLCNRIQYIQVFNACSKESEIICGIPQESLLVPGFMFIYDQRLNT